MSTDDRSPHSERVENLLLIGMPGVGKSTVGVLLAKATRRHFIDTDVAIQAREGRALQQIIDSQGLRAFCHIEEAAILELDLAGHVVATGGSVVYSNPAMRKLAATGPVIHLDLPVEDIKNRIENLDARGVVMGEGRTLDDLFAEREPLYRAWADITIDCQDKTQ